MTKNELVAGWIVQSFKDALKPGASTWGDRFPEAHADLFGDYRVDLELDIIGRLARAALFVGRFRRDSARDQASHKEEEDRLGRIREAINHLESALTNELSRLVTLEAAYTSTR